MWLWDTPSGLLSLVGACDAKGHVEGSHGCLIDLVLSALPVSSCVLHRNLCAIEIIRKRVFSSLYHRTQISSHPVNRFAQYAFRLRTTKSFPSGSMVAALGRTTFRLLTISTCGPVDPVTCYLTTESLRDKVRGGACTQGRVLHESVTHILLIFMGSPHSRFVQDHRWIPSLGK